MESWPEITEPLLRERQAMSDEEYFAFFAGLLDQVGTRVLDDAHYEQAIGYPWGRRPGSCLVTDGHVEDIDPARHDAVVREFVDGGRVPLLAYGANASPERLALKFAHLPAGHRRALILAGDLEGFDVGATAQPPLFSSMPGTLVPSPGTRVRVAVLFADAVQFTTLWWTELSYRVGALAGVDLQLDELGEPTTRVLAFVSRYGAFCIDGEPVAMSAIDGRDRRFTALTQEAILDAAARMTLGDAAVARDLIKAAYERPASFFADHFAAFRASSLQFESPHWTPMPHE